MDMKYWKQFENSGKIEDYLHFVAEKGNDCFATVGEDKVNNCHDHVVKKKELSGGDGFTGEVSDAGIYHCDRNHIETAARWRV